MADKNDIDITRIDEDAIYEFTLAATAYGWSEPMRLRPYQLTPAVRIVDSVLEKRGEEIVTMFSRQSGKTTTVPGATLHFLTALSEIHPSLKGGFRAGIFGPTKKQSTNAFDMYKRFLNSHFLHDMLNIKILVSNSYKIHLSNGVEIYCDTASENSNIEGITIDLALIDEAQKVTDNRLLNSIYPMLSSTNGTRVMTGTPTPERAGYFYQMSSQMNDRVFRAAWDICALYSEKYEIYVKEEMRKHGPTSDYFRTQYGLEWISNTINFCTIEELLKLRTGAYMEKTDLPVVISVDTARINDSTIVTVMTLPTYSRKANLCYWKEWVGDNYKLQARELIALFNNYSNIRSINFDTTHGGAYGIIDALPPGYPILPVHMSVDMQDKVWSLLREAIVEQYFTYANVDKPERYRFEQQMTQLKTGYNHKKYKVAAASGKHDDYADSLLLAWLTVSQSLYHMSDNRGVSEKDEGAQKKDEEASQTSKPAFKRPQSSNRPVVRRRPSITR